MFEIQEIAVDPVIPSLRFRCDLGHCKGACCTIPGTKGAPLLDEETEELQHAFPAVKKYLSKSHLEAIERQGLFEGTPGDFATTCVDGKACVFVVFEDGIAKCSLEKAFLNNETRWRKPLSCHLFPIRVDRGLQERIRYEQLPDCSPGLELGSATDTRLVDFVEAALVRAFGTNWVQQLKAISLGTEGYPRSDSSGSRPWQP